MLGAALAWLGLASCAAAGGGRALADRPARLAAMPLLDLLLPVIGAAVVLHLPHRR